MSGADPAVRREFLERLAALACTNSTNPTIAGLGKLLWDRLVTGYPVHAKASGRKIDMALVIGTVGTIDPTSICDDPECGQRGEMMKDHHVTHSTKGKKKGMRGECPHCHGKLHNMNDASQLIAFQCLWRQAFGDKARSTQVTAASLGQVAAQIMAGTISKWADRSALLAVLSPSAPLPKAVAAPVVAGAPAPLTGSAPSAASTSPAKPAVTAPASTPLAGPTPAASPITASAPIVDEAAKAEKRAKLRAALKGAKVTP